MTKKKKKRRIIPDNNGLKYTSEDFFQICNAYQKGEFSGRPSPELVLFTDAQDWLRKGLTGDSTYKQFLKRQFEDIFKKPAPNFLNESKLKTVIGYRICMLENIQKNIIPSNKFQKNYKASQKMIEDGSFENFTDSSKQLFNAEEKSEQESINQKKEDEMAVKKAKKKKVKGVMRKSDVQKKKKETTTPAKSDKGEVIKSLCDLLLKNNQLKLSDQEISDKFKGQFSFNAIHGTRYRLNNGDQKGYSKPKPKIERFNKKEGKSKVNKTKTKQNTNPNLVPAKKKKKRRVA